jgi:branched-chain amino acid transport system ATP-binding protein
MLTLKNLDVFYGSFQVLWDVSLELPAGQVTCILGPNGAGKSTVLKAIAGLVPSRGKITFGGEDVSRIPTPERVSAGISLVLERRRLFADLSVAENLMLGGFQLEKSRRNLQRERVLALIPKLGSYLRQRAGDLSGGQQQLVAIGRGLMADPRLLMLDEPFLGLSPAAVEEILVLVGRLNDDGLSILFNEQDVQRSLDMSHNACLLESGRVVANGTSRDIGESGVIERVYLGGVTTRKVAI